MPKIKGKYVQSSMEGLNIPASRLGPSTNPTVNQLVDMNLDANWGTKNIEVGYIHPKTMELTPKQFYDEMRRLAKAAGVEVSVHAPVVNLAGLDLQEHRYKESTRKREERRLKEMIDNAKRIFGDKSGIVNVHASEAVISKMSYVPEGAKGEEVVEIQSFVDPETGEVLQAQRIKKLVDGKVIELEPKKLAEEVVGRKVSQLFSELHKINEDKRKVEEELKRYQKFVDALEKKGLFLKDLERNKSKLAQKEREQLDRYIELTSTLQHLDEMKYDLESRIKRYAIEYNDTLKKYKGDVKKFLQDIRRKYGSEENYIRKRAEEHYAYLKDIDPKRYKQLVERDAKLLKGRLYKFGVVYPGEEIRRYIDIVDFEKDKAAETIKNAALYAYEKYGKKAPVISVENPYPYVPFGRPKDLLRLVTEARERLAKDLVKKKHMSKSEAKKLAEKLIGVTWDVGHINLLKQYGFDDKKLLEEFKELNKKGVIKHVHITDNFGYEDSHLAPGWGNVPIKEYLKELEKKGYFGKFVIEAGGAEQMHQETKGIVPMPYGPTLAYFGSSIYSALPQGERWTDFVDEFSAMYSPEFPTPRESVYQGYFTNLYGSFSGVPGVFGAAQKEGESKSKFSGSSMV